jgi:AcrR family transcriptional regulator
MTADRAPRADAQRNRARILQAAREMFAAEGPQVSLDQIASRAGVGAGTVHRNFPTKDALIISVIGDRLTSLADTARSLSDVEPEAAFYTFLREIIEQARANAILTEALGAQGPGDAVSAQSADLFTQLDLLLTRAQKAGAVRTDLSAGDLHAILGGVIDMERRLPPGNRGIGLDIVSAGLRPR